MGDIFLKSGIIHSTPKRTYYIKNIAIWQYQGHEFDQMAMSRIETCKAEVDSYEKLTFVQNKFFD